MHTHTHKWVSTANILMIYFLFYVHWYFVCMYVCVRVSNPLELELQTLVSCHVGNRNCRGWTQILWKSRQCSWQLSHLCSCTNMIANIKISKCWKIPGHFLHDVLCIGQSFALCLMHSLSNSLYTHKCVCVCVYAYMTLYAPHTYRIPWRPEEDIRFSGTIVTNRYKLSHSC